MSNIGNKETFSKNLLHYIERKGLTQKEVAEAIEVSASTFNEWVNAKKYPRIDKIEKLANYFGIQKSDLIEEKNNSTNESQLTDGEEILLDLFRKVPEESQQMVIEMIRIALKKK